MQETFHSLHAKALRVASNFKSASYALLQVFIELEENKVYRHYDCKNLYSFARKEMKLSEDVARNHIAVSVAMKRISKLKTALKNDDISFSRALRILPVINKENANHWIEQAKTLTNKDLQREVAGLAPNTLALEKVKFISGGRLEVVMIMTVEEMKALKHAQDVLSQRKAKACTLAETISVSANEYAVRNDPFEKANRALHRAVLRDKKKRVDSEQSDATSPVLVRENEELKTNLPIKHQVHLRDQNQCTHIDNGGNRCDSKRWLHIHHEVQRSHGGEDTLENLTTLCSAHHKMEHVEQWVDFL